MQNVKQVAAVVGAMLVLAGCEPELGYQVVDVHPLPADLEALEVDYIPFETLDQGSEYGSNYLAMELAVAGIPSSAITVVSCDGRSKLHGPEGFRWISRTSVLVGPEEAPRVIEPVLSAEYLTIDAWRAAFRDERAIVVRSAAAYPDESWNDRPCGGTVVDEPVPATLEQMTPFLAENVMIYCAYARAQLRRSGQDVEAREARLIERTRELFQALDAEGLIEGDAKVREQLEAGAWCPEPNFGA